MKCEKCEKEFEKGNRPDGMPNGIGFVTKDGKEHILCTDCICKMTEKEMNEIARKWNGE